MKKFILIISLTIFGLIATAKADESKIPTEIQRLRKTNQFDTVLLIPTDSRVYMFDKQGKYIDSYKQNKPEVWSASDIVIIIICLLIFVLCIIA